MPCYRDRPRDLLIGALAQERLVAFLPLADAHGVDYIDHGSG